MIIKGGTPKGEVEDAREAGGCTERVIHEKKEDTHKARAF